ncbi:hypothetical protein Hanom_Chr10g00958721 [Helianthus anomalus]
MSFDLGEDFVFDQELARALIEHKSPIRPLHDHFLLLGRLCFQWSQGDEVWPVIHRKRDRTIMSLLDALKVPSFDVLAFDLEDQRGGVSSSYEAGGSFGPEDPSCCSTKCS